MGIYTGTQPSLLIQDTLNANTFLTGVYSVSFDEKTGKLTIGHPNNTFAIPTRDELINTVIASGNTWGGAALDKNDLRDCNDVIGFNAARAASCR